VVTALVFGLCVGTTKPQLSAIGKASAAL